MSDVPVQNVPDDMIISQCGKYLADGTWKFTNRPRPLKEPPELDVSWLLGELTPWKALVAAFGRDNYRPGRDAVRHARVGTLRAAGFVVEHTPRLGSQIHVSVLWPEGDWGDSQAELLDSLCEGGAI